MQIKKDKLLKTTKMWDGVKYKNLNISNPEITVLKITVPQGQVLKMHKHVIVNVAYVEQGVLKVETDDNKSIEIHEGECLAEVMNKYHFGKNAGNVPLKLVIFYIGEKGLPLSEDFFTVNE